MRTSSITARRLRILHGWAYCIPSRRPRLRVLHGWAARMLYCIPSRRRRLRVLHGWAARMLYCIPSRRLLGVRSRWVVKRLGLANRGRHA